MRRAKGEGSIKERKDGRYEGRLPIGKDGAGKTVYRYVSSRSKRDVVRQMKELRGRAGPVRSCSTPTRPNG